MVLGFWARRQGEPEAARGFLRRLLEEGHDGYYVQMARAELALAGKDLAGGRAALQAAHRFDPSMAEPLRALAEIAGQQGRTDDEARK
jgi:predicted Zn-dependent protease